MKKLSFIIFTACALFSLQATKKNTELIFNLKALEKSLKLIPAGSMQADTIGWLVGKIRSYNSFYMYEHEVSNRDYLIFLKELKDKALYNRMLPDTLVWRDKLAYNEPYVELYLRHPSYWDYPVIGITQEQAQYYCKWLTQRYAKEEKRKFSKAEFRLPTSYEWEYAARGGLEFEPFPWSGPYLQNTKGQWLANFRVMSQADIARKSLNIQQSDGTIKTKDYLVADFNNGPGVAMESPFDNASIPAPAISYFPNNYGLYNMAGNVEELVAEPGIARGGSYYDTGYYLQNRVTEQYDSAHSTSFERGFRFVMVVLE